ncbi:MAG: DUF418 domain-containing protein, partial [Dermabacteraceae bacterium]
WTGAASIGTASIGTALAGAAVRGIEALGTVSLSAYIAQSVLFLALFPPFTLDLGATLGSAGTAGIVVLAWLAMLPLAAALRRHGRRGPLEVVLRQLAGSNSAGSNSAGSNTAPPQRGRPAGSPSKGARR